MTTPIELFAFSGKIGSGKNYLAEQVFARLLPEKPTLILAFADQLKIECCVLHGTNYHDVFHSKDKNSRILLQQFGTDMRDKHGHDVWVRYLDLWIKLFHERGIQRFIITDLRYPDEFDWVKSLKGVLFRIEAPRRNFDELTKECQGDMAKFEQIKNHHSETSLDDHVGEFDFVVNNDYDQADKVQDFMRNVVDLQFMA